MCKGNSIYDLKCQVAEALGAKPTLDSLMEVMAKTFATIDHYVAEWRQKAEKTAACRSSCAYCCAQVVWTTEPEAIYLAESARQNKLEQLLLSRVAEHRKIPKQAAGPARRLMACPFLYQDNSCFVYGARPIACRMLYAPDVQQCFDALRGGRNVKYFKHPADMSIQIRSGLIAALGERGLHCQTLEFTAAMEIALSEPDSSTRWLARENSFEAAVASDQPLDISLMARLAANPNV